MTIFLEILQRYLHLRLAGEKVFSLHGKIYDSHLFVFGVAQWSRCPAWKDLTTPRGCMCVCVRRAAGNKLTVFLVVENLEVLFDTGGQCFLNVGYRVLWRQRPVQEITHRRPLHHLRPAEAGQAAEAVAAVDDVALALLCIGHQKTSI